MNINEQIDEEKELVVTASIDVNTDVDTAETPEEDTRTEIQKLKDEADELGIEYPGNISSKKLKSKIDNFKDTKDEELVENKEEVQSLSIVSTETVSLMNTTSSVIALRVGRHKVLSIYPKQISKMPAKDFETIKKTTVVRHWLEKGCLVIPADYSGQDTSKTLSVQEAPAELTPSHSLTEGDVTINASLKKKTSAGMVEV